jgi:hypothetical protein
MIDRDVRRDREDACNSASPALNIDSRNPSVNYVSQCLWPKFNDRNNLRQIGEDPLEIHREERMEESEHKYDR